MAEVTPTEAENIWADIAGAIGMVGIDTMASSFKAVPIIATAIAQARADERKRCALD